MINYSLQYITSIKQYVMTLSLQQQQERSRPTYCAKTVNSLLINSRSIADHTLTKR